MTDKPERLWAPWRYEYIASTVDGDSDCFLCEAISVDKDIERLVLYRGKQAYVILNRYPYTNGHLLIVPNRHVEKLSDLGSEEHNSLFNLVTATTGWLDDAYHPHGFNIGLNLGRAAGAGLPGHLHVHVVPRWNGDTNCMPVLAGIKVISESLNATFSRLKEYVKLWEKTVES